MRLVEAERDFLEDEKPRVFPQAAANQFVQLAAPQDVVRRLAAQAQIGKRHLHILPDFEQLRCERRTLVVLRGLKQQIHRCDRRLDLVGPERIVVLHVLSGVFDLRLDAAPVRAERAE
ncbi:hypothetical protein SDC9_84131 [bioreactor metagenome]|uniref:Uncharacterized protein n=1 Tax=bioreactor metagenome TaxID=1076179 RepID=A0A644ZFN0_9ZZZZ